MGMNLRGRDWPVFPNCKQNMRKLQQLVDGELNKSNLEMTTDYFHIKYQRPMRIFCIKNKANETKLTATEVMI